MNVFHLSTLSFLKILFRSFQPAVFEDVCRDFTGVIQGGSLCSRMMCWPKFSSYTSLRGGKTSLRGRDGGELLCRARFSEGGVGHLGLGARPLRGSRRCSFLWIVSGV